MDIIRATASDVDDITRLFEATIRTVNAKDYSPQQVEVWVDTARHRERWLKKIEEQCFYVALLSGEVVGFSSIAKDGYLDFMFVHRDFQGQGIAKNLLQTIEKKGIEQENELIYVHVSKTAYPFFLKMGYKETGKQERRVQGITFVNSIMEKQRDDFS